MLKTVVLYYLKNLIPLPVISLIQQFFLLFKIHLSILVIRTNVPNLIHLPEKEFNSLVNKLIHYYGRIPPMSISIFFKTNFI